MVLLTMDNLQLWVISDLELSSGTSMDGSVVSRLLICAHIYILYIYIYLYTHIYIYLYTHVLIYIYVHAFLMKRSQA